MVECTALEMRHGCKPIGGSNPPLSAITCCFYCVFSNFFMSRPTFRPTLDIGAISSMSATERQCSGRSRGFVAVVTTAFRLGATPELELEKKVDKLENELERERRNVAELVRLLSCKIRCGPPTSQNAHPWLCQPGADVPKLLSSAKVQDSFSPNRHRAEPSKHIARFAPTAPSDIPSSDMLPVIQVRLQLSPPSEKVRQRRRGPRAFPPMAAVISSFQPASWWSVIVVGLG